jgi:alpha-mannosidase
MDKRSSLLSRREFLAAGAAATSLIATRPLFPRSLEEQPNGDRKVLHIIGYSHIDAAWLWPWRDGADAVLDTFRSALRRMDENPGFRYSATSSAHYRWTEGADPSMFAEVRKRIAEGRWEVVSGWPVEPDCNIPSTESFVRHSLYGLNYCQTHLGVRPRIAMNPDSFGHAAGLPTILKNAGYGYYAFMRPQENEMKLPLLFWWQGPDGSRVLTLRIWRNYDPADHAADFIRSSPTQLYRIPGIPHAAMFLGVGDHGGAVTRKQIQQVLELRNDPSLPELRWSTLAEYFEAVEKSPGFANVPVVNGELQHHSRGCFSTFAEGKILNRRAERSLGEAETILVSAGLAIDKPYPLKEFADSWWKVNFCQFHDLMAGTALYEDYTDLRDSVGYACEVATTSKVEALQAIAMQVDTTGVPENALFLFNPLPWRRKALAEVLVSEDVQKSGPMHLAAKDGTTVPLQWRPSPSMTGFYPRLSTLVELPPCGYKVFELQHGDVPSNAEYSSSFQIAKTGFGVSSFKSEDGAELLSGPSGLVVIHDPSDTWAHDVLKFRDEMGRPQFDSVAVVETGPLTRITRQRGHWRDSEIVLNVREYAGLDLLELHFIIDWREREQMLKFEIPTSLAQPRLFAKVPGAILERHTNGEEEPYQDWAAIQGTVAGNPYSVALINDGTYSYDCLDGLFRTVLIRSAPYARHRPYQVPPNDDHAWQDQGRQERTFWLLGGKGEYDQLALDRRADELQSPAQYVMDSAHSGKLPWENSFLEITPKTVEVLAIKHAEASPQDRIVRLQERSGRNTEATVRSTVAGIDQKISLLPWEIKTLRIHLEESGKAELSECSLLEA